jgi:hypothetical protein
MFETFKIFSYVSIIFNFRMQNAGRNDKFYSFVFAGAGQSLQTEPVKPNNKTVKPVIRDLYSRFTTLIYCHR